HLISVLCFLFLNDPSTPQIYTLSLHDALPIFDLRSGGLHRVEQFEAEPGRPARQRQPAEHVVGQELRAAHQQILGEVERSSAQRSEEHTSELQSRENLVCRLLLEKKKKDKSNE